MKTSRHPTKLPRASGIQQDTVANMRAAGRLKRHHILGSVDDFEQELTAQKAKEVAPEAVEDAPGIDPAMLSDDIQQALELAPDLREDLLDAYNQLATDRDLLRRHMETLTNTRNQERHQTNERLGKTISEAIKEGENERALDKWSSQQLEWSEMHSRLAWATARQPDELAMARGQDWREREEILEHLLKSIPLNKRGHGAEQWRMSLRGAWERWVPVGSMFSGLFTAVYDKPSAKDSRELLKVSKHDETSIDPNHKRSLRCAPPPTLKTTSSCLKARNRSWADSEWLRHQTYLYRKHMKALQPHNPNMDELYIVGEAIENKVWDTIHREVALEDIARLVIQNKPEAKEDVENLLETVKTQRTAEREVEERANDIQDFPEHNSQGPRLTISSDTLLFYAAPNKLCEATVRINNTGSTAVFFDWVNEKPELPDPATGGLHEDRFFLFNRKGAILPGHYIDFRFAFRSTQPGRFLETWTINTSPKTIEALPTLSLRGLAVVYDTTKLKRRNCIKKLDSREKMRKVSNAIERLIRNVESPPPERPKICPLSERKREIFDGQNINLSPPVYFDEAAFDEMTRIYSKIYEVLYPPTVEEDKKPTKAAKGKKKNPEPEVAVEERPPETWDGSVDTLKNFIAKLQQTANPDAEKHTNELTNLLCELRLPSHERLIVHQAVRRLLLKIAESMDEIAPRIAEECMERYNAARGSSRSGQEDEDTTESAEEDAASYNPEEYTRELFSASRSIITNTLSVENQISFEKSFIAEYMDGIIDDTRNAYQEAFSNQSESRENLEELSWAEFALLRKKGKLRLETDIK